MLKLTLDKFRVKTLGGQKNGKSQDIWTEELSSFRLRRLVSQMLLTISYDTRMDVRTCCIVNPVKSCLYGQAC